VLVLIPSSAVYAEGGSSIAAAPTIVLGQQEFGFVGATCFQDWLLPVVAGDKI
jgi:hypothetical protein